MARKETMDEEARIEKKNKQTETIIMYYVQGELFLLQNNVAYRAYIAKVRNASV